MAVNKNNPAREAITKLGYLHALARIDNKPVKKTAFHTMDAKTLKCLFLDTGGVTPVIIGATVYQYKIETRHLGVGVYNVWLELIPKIQIKVAERIDKE